MKRIEELPISLQNCIQLKDKSVRIMERVAEEEDEDDEGRMDSPFLPEDMAPVIDDDAGVGQRLLKPPSAASPNQRASNVTGTPHVTFHVSPRQYINRTASRKSAIINAAGPNRKPLHESPFH